MRTKATHLAVGIILSLRLGFGQQTLTGSITVDATQILKPTNPNIIGGDIEWVNFGDNLWDSVLGNLRQGLINQTQALQPGNLVFPAGGLSYFYHWRNGIGPQWSRPILPNVIDSGWSTNSFGTHEFMSLVGATGASPILKANIITGTPQEAADWVTYCNAPVNAQRAANGSPAPFNVKMWELGNEEYENPFITPQYYAQIFQQYAAAMKAADPTIQVGAASGVNFGRYNYLAYPNWNQVLLQTAAPSIDFLIVHNAYAPAILNANEAPFDDVYRAMLAMPVLVGANLQAINSQIDQYAAPADANRIKIRITEWGPLFAVSPSSPWVGHEKTLGSGVFTASMLRTFILARRVDTSSFFKLVDTAFQGSMYKNGAPKPSYYAMQMIRQNLGSNVVNATASGPTYNSVPAGVVEAVPNAPYLESLATLSADGMRLNLVVINKHLYSPIQTTIAINGFTMAGFALREEMTAGCVDANNGNDLPVTTGVTWATQYVSPVCSMFNSGTPVTVMPKWTVPAVAPNTTLTFPAMSVTALEFFHQ